MVEKSHTSGEPQANWLQGLYDPLRRAGQKIADYFAPSSEAAATASTYEISVELPGVKAEDIDVSVHDNVVSIKGEKRFQREEKGRTYFFSERAYGAFQRSFRLPPDANGDAVSADYNDGVLTISVPKMGDQQKAGRRIEVKRG